MLLNIDRMAIGTSMPYLAPRSKIRKRGAFSKGKACRNRCTIHMLVGCLVTLKCTIFRRSWSLTKKQ
jgi:hypothetical protein